MNRCMNRRPNRTSPTRCEEVKASNKEPMDRAKRQTSCRHWSVKVRLKSRYFSGCRSHLLMMPSSGGASFPLGIQRFANISTATSMCRHQPAKFIHRSIRATITVLYCVSHHSSVPFLCSYQNQHNKTSRTDLAVSCPLHHNTTIIPNNHEHDHCCCCFQPQQQRHCHQQQQPQQRRGRSFPFR